MDIETASPPVSPRVVARILMIQNTSVTSGTLLRWISSSMRVSLNVRTLLCGLGLNFSCAPQPIEIIERGQSGFRFGSGQREHQSLQADQGRAVQRHLPRTAARNCD